MVIGLLIRGGVVAGAVFYSHKLGVWGSPEQTDKIYHDVKAQICPYVQQATKKLPFELPQMPKVGEMRFLAKHYYNEGVKSSFHFVHMLPCYAGRGLKKAKDAFNDFAQAPAAITASKEEPAPSATK